MSQTATIQERVFPLHPKGYIDIFPPPPGGKVIGEKNAVFVSQEEANATVNAWKGEARRIGKKEDRSDQVIISLFDFTGTWSKPYVDAGYTVIMFDIMHSGRGTIDIWDEDDLKQELKKGKKLIKVGGDLLHSWPYYPEIIKQIRTQGRKRKIVGLLAATPCTTWAVSGARHWPKHDTENFDEVDNRYGWWAAKHFDSPRQYNEALIDATREWIYRSAPTDFYVMENPVGRIGEIADLPDPTLTFQPYLYGDPYTKKTLLWGVFNPDLPQCAVDPHEGSKKHMVSGWDKQQQKIERSTTPSGFAYSFFIANVPNEIYKKKIQTETSNMKNLFIGDEFFKQNPSKVLGTQTTRKGRFGSDMIVVEGSLSNIEKIEASPVPVVNIYPEHSMTAKTEQAVIDKVFSTEEKETTEKKVKQRRSKKEADKTSSGEKAEVYSFQEIDELYNQGISRDEKEAYYITHPELNHKLLFDKFENTNETLLQKDLICWDPDLRQYVYKYTYLSGNISKKISDLNRDKDRFIEKLGEARHAKQIEMLMAVRPKQKGFMGDERIVLLPHSKFAKEFLITELRYGQPQLYGEESVFMAFKRWLYAQPADVFKKSNSREIIDYYLNNKSIPIDSSMSKEEKIRAEKNEINIRQRTKEEGDELFARFLSDELLPEDQAKLSFLWNEKFNSLAEPDLNKIPVCFQISKKFKQGPLMLNPTQRRAAAFQMEKFSALFAYGVGVGKTLASIVAFSQSYYNGYAKKGCFVVPTNTYDKWIGEIQGYRDERTGVFMHGALPQLPPVVGLFNLNPDIVKEKLKVYTDAEQEQLSSILQAIDKVKAMEGPDITANQQILIDKIYKVNWLGIESGYAEYLENTGSKTPQTQTQFLADYLKDEYNYYIYALGTIKSFPEGTIFVTTEVGLQRLGLNEVHKEQLSGTLYTILSQGEQTADDKSGRDIAKLQEKIDQTISSSMKKAKLLVEDLGIDWTCFDEAHLYKKIFTYVKGEVVGEKEDRFGDKKLKREKAKYELRSGAFPSSRALSAFVLSHYIQATNNNRNVIQLTATPFTNSPLEVYSMLALTNYYLLKELGLANMTDFFDTFMRINYDIKYTPQKTVVKDEVLTGYNNLPQLRQIIYSLMDKKDEGANLKRPIKLIWPSIEKNIQTTLPMTSEQEELMRSVKDYIQGNTEYESVCAAALADEVENLDYDSLEDDLLISEWERATSKEYDGARENLSDAKRDQLIKAIKSAKMAGTEFSADDLEEEEAAGVRILKGLAMMRQITLSPYLYYKACRKAGEMAAQMPDYDDYVNSSPKFKYVMGCIETAMAWHKKSNSKPGGHVLYMNAGVEYFPLLKEYLIKKLGFKETQVGIVSGKMSKGAKEAVKQRFLSGDCLVLIGSSTISVGVDLQNNATTLYNLYYDWNPTDAAQIEGRIWRQGNRFAFVRIIYPQCYNSADPVIFEYLSAKTLRINEIWNRSSEVQELDLRDFDPKKLQKELITDPEEKADWEILEESDRIQSDIIYAENRRDSLQNALYAYREIKRLKPVALEYMNGLANQKTAIARKEAITAQKEKINEIVDKFGDKPDKMADEITKYKKSRYDHEGDPEGKYTPVNYSDLGDEKLYTDAKKFIVILEEMRYNSEGDWGDFYLNRSKIIRDLQDFRNNYKDMKASEERIMKPLGLSFENAENPMDEFNKKLTDLQEQLGAIEASKPERVHRIRAELSAKQQVIKTVDDRIIEYAAGNDQYLGPQLGQHDTRADQTVPLNKDKIVVAKAEEKLKKQEKPPAPAPAPKATKVEKENARMFIEKQIQGLTTALPFADDKEQIQQQINALNVALQFAA